MINSSENYKETGVDWILKIPNDWDVSRAKYLFKNKSLKNFPDEPLLSVTQQDGVVARSDSKMNVWNPGDDVSGYKLIEPGDFVISLRSFEGGLELSDLRGLVSPAYTVLQSIKTINDRYFRWLMKSYKFIIELNKNVTGIRQGKNISWDDFANIYLTVPHLEEQKRIARYLDIKIKKVDLLVEKIQKKIELLKEQRSSLIEHYITKGLDPNAKMKYSGVEWIGKIPSHWEISKYKYEITIQNGYPLKSELFDNEIGFPIIRIRDVTSGNIETYYTGELVDTHIVTNGDLLIGMDGDFNVRWWTGPKSLLNQRVCRVFEGNNYKRRYLYYLLPLQLKVINDLTYYTTVKHLSSFDILGIKTILPPISEQKEIIKKIDKITTKQDLLIEKNNFKILKLKEYRQSMISSVVTGKVRVTEDII